MDDIRIKVFGLMPYSFKITAMPLMPKQTILYFRKKRLKAKAATKQPITR